MSAKKIKKKLISLAAVAIWLIIWQAAAMIIGSEIVLVSPLSVLRALLRFVVTSQFWLAVWGSFYRIACGFLLAAAAGVIFAVLAYKVKFIKEFLAPPMTLFKTVPVASFIIMLLIAMRSKTNLSLIICFIMVLPIIYTNVLSGLSSVDKKMLEMARMYSVGTKDKMVYLYTAETLPHFITGAKIGLGLCWKSGVAAELIGLVQNTIGNELYYAKLYLLMDNVFAWTAAIIVISVAFETVVLGLLKLLKRGIER